MEAMIEQTLLLLVRVSAFVAFLPLVGGKTVPRTIRIGLAVALTFYLLIVSWPQLLASSSLVVSTSWAGLATSVIREVTIGAGMGWLIGLIFVPVRISGEFIAEEMGLTIANLTAATGEASSNVLAEILHGVAVLAFLSMNGHHLFVVALHRGVNQFPIAGQWQSLDTTLAFNSITATSQVGLYMSMPVAVVMAMATLTMLFIMRQTPQFNLFNFGMPFRLLFGLAALTLFAPSIIYSFLHLFQTLVQQLS